MGLSRLIDSLAKNPRTIFNELLNEGITYYNRKELGKKDHKFFRTSNIGACMRKVYFQAQEEKAAEKEPSFWKKVNYGSVVHELYQDYLAGTGNLFGNWFCSLCGEIDGPSFGTREKVRCNKTNLDVSRKYSEILILNSKLKISGHPDGFLRLTGNRLVLIEIKTITPYYKIAESIENVKKFVPEHVHQANFYLGLVQEKSSMLEKVDKDVFLNLLDPSYFMLIYLDKGSDDTVPYDFPFNEEMYRADKIRLADYWACVANKKVPAAESNLGKCKYCNYISQCNLVKFGDKK